MADKDAVTEKIAVVEVSFTTTVRVRVDDFGTMGKPASSDFIMKQRAIDDVRASPFDHAFDCHPDAIPGGMEPGDIQVLELQDPDE